MAVSASGERASLGDATVVAAAHCARLASHQIWRLRTPDNATVHHGRQRTWYHCHLSGTTFEIPPFSLRFRSGLLGSSYAAKGAVCRM